jgi:Domain of unknown function (DUF5658)
MSLIRLNIFSWDTRLRRFFSVPAKSDCLPQANGDLRAHRTLPRDDSKMDMLTPDLAFDRIPPDHRLAPCDGTADMGSNGPGCRVRDDGGRTTQLLFVYLQMLDFITTLLGFRLGAGEASPFVCLLMHAGPQTGVLISKLLALALGGACLYLKKRHLLRWANYWYSGLVLWNLLIISARLGGVGG